MKTLRFLSFSLALTATLPAASAKEDRIADLERICAEQERQIAHLEEENSRLVMLVDEKLTKPTSSPQPEVTRKSVAASAPIHDAGTAATETETASTPTHPVHIVRQGDNLTHIARKHGTTTHELTKLNGLKNAQVIRIGQRLKLPVQTTDRPTHSGADQVAHTHRVMRGETFYSIARQHDITVDQLRKANPDVKATSLRIGQELKLGNSVSDPETAVTSSTGENGQLADNHDTSAAHAPDATETRPTLKRVRVGKVQTIEQFAQSYSMKADRLLRLNGLHDLDFDTPLAEGSELYVSAQP